MSAMLLKDWYCFWTAYRKNVVTVVILYGFLTVSSDMAFLACMLPYLMSYYGLSCIAMDDQSGWNVYGRTLPTGVEGNASAKYVFILLSSLFGLVCCWGMGGIHTLLRPGAVDWVTDYFVAGLVCLLTALLMMSVIVPAALKYGVEKARNGMLWVSGAVIGALALVRFGVGGVFAPLTDALHGGFVWLNDHPAMLFAALGVAAAAAYAVSWRAGCRICREKEG
ncbi:MAG: ABC-2 transporter permease [Oscillospiraceae bacterium]|nr:ABC-2 transporter permease [Oscillospiraceae bacterium]